MTQTTSEADRADSRQFARPEGRIFGLEREDGVTDLVWEGGMLGGFRRREEARHAVFLESGSLAIEGTARHAGDLSALVRRVANEDNRTDHLVEALLGKLDEQVQLFPVVCGFETRAQTCWHEDSRNGRAPRTGGGVVLARRILCRVPRGR